MSTTKAPQATRPQVAHALLLTRQLAQALSAMDESEVRELKHLVAGESVVAKRRSEAWLEYLTNALWEKAGELTV